LAERTANAVPEEDGGAGRCSRRALWPNV